MKNHYTTYTAVIIMGLIIFQSLMIWEWIQWRPQCIEYNGEYNGCWIPPHVTIEDGWIKISWKSFRGNIQECIDAINDNINVTWERSCSKEMLVRNR